MSGLAFVDTETTGLGEKCEPWEIGIITRDFAEDGSALPDAEYLYRVWPDMEQAEPDGLRIGRFYERTAMMQLPAAMTGQGYQTVYNLVDMEDGDPERWSVASYAASKVATLLDGRHLVGKVPDFDARMLTRWLRKQGQCLTSHYHLIDVETLAVGYLRGLAAHGHSSITCAESPDCAAADSLSLPWNSRDLDAALGLQQSEDSVHTALGDARNARDVWDKVMAGA